ncbi:MAG: leucine-rich repeat protein, partial [Clostridia bacterium]|nr:leucine-rich repeat protein [Clostridia bacterium]
IGDCAFLGVKDLTSLTLPASLETIGDNAFCDADKLTELNIPENVT